MESNIMERLKAETGPYHRQVESNRYARAITDQTLTLNEYRLYLQKFYGFVYPMEGRLPSTIEWKGSTLRATDRTKSGLLVLDLLQLGLTQEDIGQLPLCTALPDVSTPAAQYGFLYVMEGSTLGGQMITAMLKQRLALEPEAGLHYFNGYGKDTRVRWSEFRETLLSAALSEEDRQAVVDAAQDTFVKLGRWLDEPQKLEAEHA
ncbi:biliverdin-producing heme oxygenase [Paenibacillus donghaensis]|uniref:Biliverdin-producing heme oxygenase n=1 Tax=Paenibacillus donghaensis TaxID=414771 RepID=A0A2Z2KFH8_9BACL|nr:biliverdin-producing heme oxygenase [Paenibacillus donghaensis]ASA20869.1 hypothetical protein B9T62_08790 [Paenibacillus donghaensis]